MNSPEIFESQGCVKVDGFLDPTTTSTISQYLENRLTRGEWSPNETELVTKISYYADPLIETVLKQSLPIVEELCGKELLPTYSYCRVYQPGEELKPHVDRPSCEISTTVSVAYKGDVSSIWTHYKSNDPLEHVLNPGDAVIYKGCEAKHWRVPLKNDQLVVQFMLHYVDKNGPNASYAYDKRNKLGQPPNARRT
jgi:hypothetical protein